MVNDVALSSNATKTIRNFSHTIYEYHFKNLIKTSVEMNCKFKKTPIVFYGIVSDHYIQEENKEDFDGYTKQKYKSFFSKKWQFYAVNLLMIKHLYQ